MDIFTADERKHFFRTAISCTEYLKGKITLDELRANFDDRMDKLAEKFIEERSAQIKGLIESDKRRFLTERGPGLEFFRIRATGTADEIEASQKKWQEYLEIIAPMAFALNSYSTYVATKAFLADPPSSKACLDACVKEITRASRAIIENSGATPAEVWDTANGLLDQVAVFTFDFYNPKAYLKRNNEIVEIEGLDDDEDIPPGSAQTIMELLERFGGELDEWGGITARREALARAIGLTPRAATKPPRPRKGTMSGQLTIWEAWESMGYLPMLQSPGYNALIHSLASPADRTDMLGKRIIDRGNLTISSWLPESVKRLPTSAAKLLDMIMIKATQTGMAADKSVALPLNEYMEARELRDKKEARNQVKRDLELLQRVDFKLKDKKAGFLNVSLSGGTRGIVNGIIGFKFNEDWLRLFPIENQIMPMPKGLFATNDNHNPHAYYFGRTIFESRRMNDGKGRECSITVKTLIKNAPSFPTYESLGEAKQIDKRIIGPFERDMQAASEVTGGKFYWNYSGVNTEKPPATYDEFINAKIFITWNQYPDTKTIKAGRAKYKKLANKGKLAGKKTSGR